MTSHEHRDSGQLAPGDVPAEPAPPVVDPWLDPALGLGQRVAAALDAGLMLGERLATVLAGTGEQAAYAAGWTDGWNAAQHHEAQAWRRVAARVRQMANQPTRAELAARRGETTAAGPVEIRPVRPVMGWIGDESDRD
jgi:hypothetical protein